MNNSVVSRLNVIDAIILLTSAKLILHPILANFSMKLPKYDFNHPLKLKPPKQNPKPKPNPICLDLPDDVIVTILSKVDIVTFQRCTLVLSLDSILPQIVSFSTPLDATLFNPDKSRSWYGKPFNKFVSKLIPLLLNILGSDSLILKTVFAVTAIVFWWVNTPKLKPQAVSFFEKFSELKSLEVELPAMPCYECVQPHLWFKWDAKFGVHDSRADYILYVFGDKVDGSDSEVRAMRMLVCHTMFHCSMMNLGYVGRDDWKTGMSITTKDVEGNGGMMIGPQSSKDGSKLRFKILQLPLTSKFNRYTNEEVDPVQLQDVMLMFIASVDASIDRDGTDVIMACLGDMDHKEGKADQKTELRQIVAQIIADENCVVHDIL